MIIALALSIVGCDDSRAPSSPTPSTPHRADKTINPEDDQPDPDNSKADVETLAGDIVIDINVELLPNHRVIIDGATNLPIGTRLMISIEDKDHDRRGQSQCDVLDGGTFNSEAIGPVDGLLPGIYTAEVLMPIPNVQPDHVRDVIGPNGENLKGPLISTDGIGVTVSKTHDFTVGDVGADEAQQKRFTEQNMLIRECIEKTENLYNRLEAARYKNWHLKSADHETLAKWGQFARQFNQDFRSLGDRLGEARPANARLLLASAVADLNNLFTATVSNDQRGYDVALISYKDNISQLKEYQLESAK